MAYDHPFLASIGILTGLLLATRAAGAQEPPTVPGAPRIHIETTSPEVLLFRVPSPEERRGLGPAYRPYGVPICRAPCDVVVDGRAGHSFLFGGADVTASERFRISRESGDVTFSVEPGSRSRRQTGAALAGIGGGLLGVGLGVWFWAFILGHQDVTVLPNGKPTPYKPGGVEIAGFAVMGTGLAALAGGIALIAGNGTTVNVASGDALHLGRWARIEGGALRF